MILDWPDEVSRANRCAITLVSNVLSATSEVTRTIQTYQQPGSRLRIDLGWDVLGPSEAAALKAFLWELDGMANRVMLYNLADHAPRGNMRGTPLVDGTNQVGRSLLVKSATPGHKLLRGDLLGIECVSGKHLVMITRDVTADGAGALTINFSPNLQSPAINGSVIEWDKPKAKFILVSGDAPVDLGSAWTARNVSLSFIQDLTP